MLAFSWWSLTYDADNARQPAADSTIQIPLPFTLHCQRLPSFRSHLHYFQVYYPQMYLTDHRILWPVKQLDCPDVVHEVIFLCR